MHVRSYLYIHSVCINMQRMEVNFKAVFSGFPTNAIISL